MTSIYVTDFQYARPKWMKCDETEVLREGGIHDQIISMGHEFGWDNKVAHAVVVHCTNGSYRILWLRNGRAFIDIMWRAMEDRIRHRF